jgi:murein DD-endopeptidase MepM/ murein hydrolase activator NlpD
MREMVEKRSSLPRAFLLSAGLLVLAGLAVEIFRVGPPPEISIKPAIPVIGKRTPVTVEIAEPKRGLSRVKVEFLQGERSVILMEKTYVLPSALAFWNSRTAGDKLLVTVGRETITGLKAGEGTIRVIADRAGTWLRHPEPTSMSINLPVRLSPPSLQVISTEIFVAQGGCEAVVYRVGLSSVRDGVRAGKWWFPGYALPGGSPGERFAFFAAPYDMSSPDLRLVAADAAENEAELTFIDQFIPKKFKADTVELSDAFMGKVVPEIMSQTPEVQDRGNLLDNYLAINKDLRRKDAEMLMDLARQSRPEFLWSKEFVSMQNGKVMAGFADERTYRYQGREVDRQTHLGYDLAATRHAPVRAANDGIVVLARYFGIYGNAILIDHGCGLMSLYGHLSATAATPGQKVARGDIIGQTGETGLAGGDHLHFAVLLNGLPVNPVEWWDRHWIQDRIARKLGAAFVFSE